MAIKFQYNKTSLTNLGKQLKIRQNALPTLKNKESALRVSVLSAKKEAQKLIQDLEKGLRDYDYLAALWNEFEPGLISITDIDLKTEKYTVRIIGKPDRDRAEKALKDFVQACEKERSEKEIGRSA